MYRKLALLANNLIIQKSKISLEKLFEMKGGNLSWYSQNILVLFFSQKLFFFLPNICCSSNGIFSPQVECQKENSRLFIVFPRFQVFNHLPVVYVLFELALSICLFVYFFASKILLPAVMAITLYGKRKIRELFRRSFFKNRK